MRIPVILVWLVSGSAVAQEPFATLDAVIVEMGTRRPVMGAVLVDADGRALAESAGNGQIHAVIAENAKHALRIVAPAFAPVSVEVAPGRNERTFRLVPNGAAVFEARVRGGREPATPTTVSLSAGEARDSAGTSGDPLRAIGLMPGVATVGYGASAPVVRGTQPAATGYYIDGIRLPYLNHVLLGPSVVHPEFIETIEFSPSAPPAAFGRQLGGVVEAKSGRPGDRLRFVGSADLVNAGAFLELPPSSFGLQVTAAARFSYSGLVTAALVGFLADPETLPWTLGVGDYQLRVEQPVGSGKVRLFVFGSKDSLESGNAPDRPRPAAHVSFHRADLRYNREVLGGRAEVGATFGADEVRAQFLLGNQESEAIGTEQASYAVRAAWSKAIDREFTFAIGFDAERRRGAFEFVGIGSFLEVERPKAFRDPAVIGTLAGGYTQVVWTPSERLVMTVGLRLDSYHLLPNVWYLAPEPRATLRYDVRPDVTLKAGAALVHQPPTMLFAVPVVELAGLRNGLQQSIHTIVGAEWSAPEGITIGLDVYYQRLRRSIEFGPLEVFDNRRRSGLPQTDPATDGYAYGVEVLARKRLGQRWFGWLAYGWQRSERRETFFRFDARNEVAGIASAYVPFAFEQRHVLNATMTYHLSQDWTIGGTIHANTGRPESGEFSSRTRALSIGADGAQSWTRVDLDKADRLPAFWRLDARVARTWRFEDFVLEGYLDFYNLSFQREVLGFDYVPGVGGSPAEKKSMDFGLLVLPMLGLKGTY